MPPPLLAGRIRLSLSLSLDLSPPPAGRLPPSLNLGLQQLPVCIMTPPPSLQVRLPPSLGLGLQKLPVRLAPLLAGAEVSVTGDVLPSLQRFLTMEVSRGTSLIVSCCLVEPYWPLTPCTCPPPSPTCRLFSFLSRVQWSCGGRRGTVHSRCTTYRQPSAPLPARPAHVLPALAAAVSAPLAFPPGRRTPP